MSDQPISTHEEQLIFSGFPKACSSLPIVLGGLGICHLQEHVDRPLGLDSWQWIQSVRGRGEMIFQGQAYTVDEGSGILLPPGTPHIYYGLTHRWIVNFLCFNGACLPQIMKTLGLLTPGVYRLTAPDVILEYEQRLYESYIASPENSRSTSAIIYELLLALSQDIARTSLGQEGSANEKVHQAICFMYSHYQENISLGDISGAAGLSREYLCQLFKRHTNFTVLDYLISIRIAKAKARLIKYPEKTISEIARLCGFESPSYFCAVFKKYEKQTPRQFRKIRR